MATAARRAELAIRRVARAQRTFNVRALANLYPDLPAASMATALLREQRFDGIYHRKMKARLRSGFRGLGTLALAERRQREASLLNTERRYLDMHIEAARDRMLKEANMVRLQRRGEPGAVWVLDHSKKTHTADCLAMEGRFWRWDVLKEINPANRHAGCGCDLRSLDQARALGIAVKRGRRTPRVDAAITEANMPQNIPHPVELMEFVEGYAEHFPHHETHGFCFACERHLRPKNEAAMPRHCGQAMLTGPEPLIEAIAVRVQGYWRTVNGRRQFVRRHTRTAEAITVPVPGTIPKRYNADVSALVTAARKGDPAAIRASHQNLRRLLLAHKNKDERQLALRTADRLYRTAIDPTGQRRAAGEKVDVGGEAVRVPLAPAERKGVSEPWSVKGSFMWQAAPGNLPLEALRKAGLKVKERKEVVTIEMPGKDSKLARQEARALEHAMPFLRTSRVKGDGSLYGQTAAIDIQDDEMDPVKWRQFKAQPSLYPGVEWDRLGDAAEVLIADVADRMKALGAVPVNDDRVEWPTAGGTDAPLDWIIDSMLIEVKGKSWRGVTAGVSKDLPSAPSISGSDEDNQLKRKRKVLAQMNRERTKQGLPKMKAVVMQVLIDLDNDHAHVVYQPHSGPVKDAFVAQRMPQQLVFDLMGGELTPGDVRRARTGGATSWYVGSFRLRINPTRGKDIGKRYSKEELEKRALSGRKPEPGDVLPPGVQLERPGRHVTRKTRPKGVAKKKTDASRKQVIALGRRWARGEMSQGEIAKELGITQGRVSQILTAAGIVKKKPKKRARGGKKKPAGGVRRRRGLEESTPAPPH